MNILKAIMIIPILLWVMLVAIQLLGTNDEQFHQIQEKHHHRICEYRDELEQQDKLKYKME